MCASARLCDRSWGLQYVAICDAMGAHAPGATVTTPAAPEPSTSTPASAKAAAASTVSSKAPKEGAFTVYAIRLDRNDSSRGDGEVVSEARVAWAGEASRVTAIV